MIAVARPESECENVSRSVVSDSLWPHGLGVTRLLCPWDSPGKNTGVGCHSLLQEIFPTQGSYLFSCVAGRFFTVWDTKEASGLAYFSLHIINTLAMHFLGFPGCVCGKESACQCRKCKRLWFNPWIRKIPWSRKWRNGDPLQYSCLGNPMDRGAWQATVHGVSKSWTRLSIWAHTRYLLHKCVDTCY